MAVVPDPRQLLLTDPDHVPSVVAKYFSTVFFSVAGTASVILSRYGKKRPVFSGLQHHLLAAFVGAAVGYFGQRHVSNYYAKRNAVYIHYMSLHPEDFPMPVRQKIGEIFPMFTPIR